MSYPVGRSAFAGAAVAVLALTGLAAVLAWVLQARAFAVPHAAGLAAVALCGAIALAGWLRSPAGVLEWTGTGWTWQEAGAPASGWPEPALDLQSRMLLRWRGEGGAVRWLWVERASDVSHWDALRRAVYSRASMPVPRAGQPPAAEQ